MKKYISAAIAIAAVLVLSFLIWNRNHLILRNPEVDVFCEGLERDHPKIVRIEKYMFRTFIGFELYYEDSQISREELIEIRDAFKDRFNRYFIEKIGRKHWGRSMYPADFSVRIYLKKRDGFHDDYDYEISSTLADGYDTQVPLSDSDNLFRYWSIATPEGLLIQEEEAM